MATEINIIGPNEIASTIASLRDSSLFEGATDEQIGNLVLGSLFGVVKEGDSMQSLREAIEAITGGPAPPGISFPIYSPRGCLNYQTHSTYFNYSAVSFRMKSPFMTYDTQNSMDQIEDDFSVTADIGTELYIFDPLKFNEYLTTNHNAFFVVLNDRDRLLLAAINVISILASPDSMLKTLRFLRLHAYNEQQRTGECAVLGWSHEQIANSLGLSRASIANHLGELRELDIVKTHYQRIDVDIEKVNNHIVERSRVDL